MAEFMLTPSDTVRIKTAFNSPNYVDISVQEIIDYGAAHNLGNAFMLIDVGNTRPGCLIRYFNISGDTAYLGTMDFIDYNNNIGIGAAANITTLNNNNFWCSNPWDTPVQLGAANTATNFGTKTIDNIIYDIAGGNVAGYKDLQGIYIPDTITNIYIDGSPLVSYQWKSVEAISGSMGIISLSMIEDDKIEEGDGGQTDLPESNITRFTDQTNIRRLCLNFTKNEWHRVAESGLNYLELKYDFYTVGGITSLLVDFHFINHYGEGNNQYYSTVYSGQLPLGLQTSGNYDQYLAFIIDEENEVAQFDPITWCRDYAHVPPINGVRYGYFSPTDQEMAALYYWLKGSPEEIDEDDPYADGSEGDGGDSNPYQPQDHIGLSSKPTKSGLNLGVVTLYKPTETEIALIADFLWSDNVLDNFKKYFNNFADNIMSFYVLPVSPEAAGISSKPFKVGNMTSDNANLQAVDYITDRYVDIDMGAFYLKRKWDSYLDVSPYTKLEVYLPFCGTHQLNTDEIVYPANMDGFLPVKPDQEIKLELNYRVDLVTGNIVATLLVNGENRYQFTGKCGMTIPLTGANYQNMVSGAITAGAGLAATIASGGLTAPLTASAAVSGTVMAQKPEVYRSGNLSGDVSMLAYDTPYLIKTIPNKPEIKNQELYTGYPSYKKATLGSFSGYTEVIEAHIDDVSCTSEEKDKIMAALKGGVII